MPITVDYDHVGDFYVYPAEIKNDGNTLESLAKTVAQSLTNISNTLNDLKLGWAGKTAEEAQEFGDRWLRVATELFGTDDHPEYGVLNVIVNGVLDVGDMFAQIEGGIMGYFDDFKKSLDASGSGGSSSHSNINDPNVTAVSEQW
jgi:hypothetical protein